MTKNTFYTFESDGSSFTSKEATCFRTIYAPLCGADAHSLKAAITPHLSGDLKVDRNRYLTKPTSTEDLRQNVRDFFVYIKDKGVYSLAEHSKDAQATVNIGLLWHTLRVDHKDAGLKLEATNFIPVTGDNLEVMKITITNTSSADITFTPTFALPIFARALDNKHDHEHVTSLLNRITQDAAGVIVTPSMAFNEEGHKPNDDVYFVLGCDDKGALPVGTFPTVESFVGRDGYLRKPDAVYKNISPTKLEGSFLQGKEAVGALRFSDEVLKSGGQKTYLIGFGVCTKNKNPKDVFDHFNTEQKFSNALTSVVSFWKEKTGTIQLTSGDSDWNGWFKWVTLQPILRRIYGCSFLPDHDYGKGGKGWRDIWQDLLSLILIEPEEVRDNLINNFAGVRIDGSNATIIGSKPGEFIGDRNNITRVWMDHGVWPLMTTILYVNQTGDYDILFERVPYFRDMQFSRAHKKDFGWNDKQGNQLKTQSGDTYQGTILEHILVQNLVQFYNVGEHNIIRLENADWNDGLDMAADRGESVAFTSCYAGNLLSIAELLRDIQKDCGQSKIAVYKELEVLLSDCSYDDSKAKQELLFKSYFSSVQPQISGDVVELNIDDVIQKLTNKAQWIFDHIRKQELISASQDGIQYKWFNGYYDNTGAAVEGLKNDRVRMTLTGQVFAIMSCLASDDEIKEVVKSVDAFLKDSHLGGVRLNSDFGVDHYLDLGRAFGFAYGTKENGAVFSHMTVMYAYALYKRGFAHEGFKVLDALYQMSADTKRSQIYPGIPEYFDANGKGMYHYLTGSASWMVLTQLTQVFGVRGLRGNLVLEPKLLAGQFDQDKTARVSCHFAGKQITVAYTNEKNLDFGNYVIKSVELNGQALDAACIEGSCVVIEHSVIAQVSGQANIVVMLG